METQITTRGEWTLRIRRPVGTGPFPLIFLLHGWKGTEDVMWVFANRIPDHFLIVAPRAIHSAPEGYSWVDRRSLGFSTLDEFRPAILRLEKLFQDLQKDFPADFTQFHIMGFSQGAAAAYCWAALQPERVASIAGLAGFLPDGIEALASDQPFAGKPVFIGHGSLDKIVPVERMRAGAKVIEQAGAVLTVCEDEVGHKLSANCGRALGHFYSRFFPAG